ncbi:MAG: carbohydrate kinase family protein [Minisyncoccia bacterium]
MFDIITFGSATFDTFLRLKEGDFKVLQDEGKDYISIKLGEKIFLEKVLQESGGGGTNSAVTFSKQGFKTAFLGKVGNDFFGEKIIKELKDYKVNTNFIKKDSKFPTNQSFIISIGKERTIFLKEGASSFLTEKDITFSKIKTKWFYLAPLRNKAAQLTSKLIFFAKKKNIKVALNPSKEQIIISGFKRLLKYVDILILNLEEASFLTDISVFKENEIFEKIKDFGPKISIITKGAKGAILLKENDIYEVGTINIKVIEKTGAGDAFGSGFLAGLLKKNDIEYALQLATANATGCIQKIGAKQGLVSSNFYNKWQEVEILKQKI